MKKKEVNPRESLIVSVSPTNLCDIKCGVSLPAKAHHGRAQRSDEEHQTSLPGGAALLLPDH